MTHLKKYIGIPYIPRACGWDGCNCGGLVILFYEVELKIKLPRLETQETDRTNISTAFTAEISRAWQPVKYPLYGDCVLFDRGREHGHVGIVINEKEMLHCDRGADTCIESFLSSAWKNSLAGFYRYVG